MGCMSHHSIVITSYNQAKLVELHDNVIAIGAAVTGIVYSPVNNYASFMVVTDGSKEGWPESDHGDAQRAEILDLLRGQAWDDGSSPFDYVEVQYGDDDLDTRVVNSSDNDYEAFEPKEPDSETEERGGIPVVERFNFI